MNATAPDRLRRLKLLLPKLQLSEKFQMQFVEDCHQLKIRAKIKNFNWQFAFFDYWSSPDDLVWYCIDTSAGSYFRNAKEGKTEMNEVIEINRMFEILDLISNT